MSGRVVVLANPTSGGGRGRRLIQPTAARLGALGFTADVVVGRDAGDAADRFRAAMAERPRAVVAVGGDGLVSMAVQEVAGTPVPLAVVAAGTGNDVARALGLTKTQPLAALDHLAADDVRPVDLARAGERWVAGVLGAGFDSRVNERANRMRWPRGRSRYNVAIVAELRTFRAVPVRIELDDEVLETSAMLVAVGNAASYGGGMRVCPGARLDDGLLDVTVVGAISTFEFLKVFPTVYKGTHVRHPAVTVRRSRRVRLEALDLVAYADGERVDRLPVDVTVRPQALQVCAPVLDVAAP